MTTPAFTALYAEFRPGRDDKARLAALFRGFSASDTLILSHLIPAVGNSRTVSVYRVDCDAHLFGSSKILLKVSGVRTPGAAAKSLYVIPAYSGK